jgi:integrase
MQLDNKTVAGLALPDGKTDVIFFDDELAGFGLRLRTSGDRVRRSWIAQYRSHGRTRRLNIGAAEKLSAAEARKQAKKELAKVALGGDPQGEKAQARLQAVHTFASVAKAYLEAKATELRPSSLRVTRLYLTGKHFKPLHTASITKITHPDVAARISAIRRSSGEVTARQARAALSAMYKWSMGEGLMGTSPFNPVIGTNVPAASIPRERVLRDDELVAIWRACKDDDFGRIVRLLILLGSRRGEVGGMCWTEIDLVASTWFLPAARSKNGHALLVPLPPAALDIVKAVPRWAARDQLFGARAKDGFAKWNDSKRELDERLGEAVAPWRLHDLRRTAATRMGDLGVLPHVIESALNHRSGTKRGIAGIYNKSPYEREVKAALALWAEHLTALAEGRENKVVPLRA